MISKTSSKLGELILKKSLDHGFKTSEEIDIIKRKVVSELAIQLGEANTHRIAGIINGKYHMKLVDAVVICRFFQLENIQDLIAINFRGIPKTFEQVLHKDAAA